MNKKKIIFLIGLLILISISVFSIYKLTYKEEFNYVALGDSIAAGKNPYGVDDYGYTDYVKDYLNDNNQLKEYISYAVSGYTINDVINDITYNRIINVNKKNVGIKKALRESDIVTISIGANDFLQTMNLSNLQETLNNEKILQQNIDSILEDIHNLLVSVKQYAKGKIIIIGYYNPLPHFEKYKKEIDEIINYVDNKYEDLCKNNKIYYVKISDKMSKNINYLPNPLDIHPNKEGYKMISDQVISLINKEFFK